MTVSTPRPDLLEGEEPRSGAELAQPRAPVTATGEPRRRRELALVLGVILLALALRLPTVAWQLPWELHPDEGHYVWKAYDMVQDGNLNPKYFRNPSLYTYLLFGEFKLLAALGLPPAALAVPSELLGSPSIYVLLGRLTTALLGAATVAAVYCLGRELLGSREGLLGALLLAVSFIHVRDSIFATNDVPATFLLTLSVLFSALLARSRRRRDLLLAALFGGLATSAKYNAGLFVAPLLVGYGLAHGRRALTPGLLAGLVGAGLLAVAAYLVGTPFTALAWPSFRDDFLVQQRFARDGWEGQGSEPVGLLYLDALGQGIGWLGLGFAVVGFTLLARRKPGAAALLGALPLAYLLLMLGVKLFFVRFALPLVPFVCLAAAYGVLAVAGLPRRPAQRKALLAALVLALVAQPLWSDLQQARLQAQIDTRALAYAWLEANLPPGTRLVVEEYSVRDRRPRAYLPDRQRFDLDQVNALSERELSHYRQQSYQYAVSSSFQTQRFPGRFDTYGELERQARPLATFAPTADGSTLPFDVEALYSPFHDLGRYERPGPTVTIYALTAQ